MEGLEVDITGFGEALHINLFGQEIMIFRELIYVTVALLAVLVLALLVGYFAKKQDVREKPHPVLICAEWLWNFTMGDVEELSDDNPKHHKTFLHVYGMNIFLFIFVANTLSMWGVHSPASNVFVSIGLGVMVLLLVHGLGLSGGIKGYFKSYLEPFALFLPINIISAVSDIISIAMRLFGNTLAAMILATLVKMSVTSIPFIGNFAYPIAGGTLMLYDIFIAYIQALLFTRLSMTYIRDKLPLED